jgi:branched-subunit amino acid ABC-type transport system permease component
VIEAGGIWVAFCFSAFYILGSYAFNLTSRTLDAPNFSIGSLIVIGAYIPFSLRIFYGYEPYTCLPFAFIVCSVTNWIVYSLVFRRLLSNERKPELIALASLAVGIVFSGLLNIWISYLREITQISPMVSYLKEFDFRLGMIRGVFLVSTMIAFSLFIVTRLLYDKQVGLILRLLFEDKALAEIQGVNSSNVYSLLWFVSGGLAGLAGSLFPFISITVPREGFLIQNSIMAASILGGMGNVFGCFFGATVVGFIEIMVTILGQRFLGAWFGEYRFFFSIAVIVLLFRYYPRGLKSQGL